MVGAGLFISIQHTARAVCSPQPNPPFSDPSPRLQGLKEDLRKAKLQVISTQKKFTDAQAKHGATSRGDTKNLLKRERCDRDGGDFFGGRYRAGP